MCKIFDKEQLVEFFKTVEIDGIDNSILTKVEDISDRTYNPFDINFSCSIVFDNSLYIGIDKFDKKFSVRIGKSSGWIGGLSLSDVLISFAIDKLDFESLKQGVLNRIDTYCLVSKWGTGNIDEVLFEGSLEDINQYALDNNYIKKDSSWEGHPHFKSYYYYNSELASHINKRILQIYNLPPDISRERTN